MLAIVVFTVKDIGSKDMKLKFFSIIVLNLFVGVVFAEDKPSLMVLASAHFSSPGKDQINIEVEDVLSARRQSEIQAVVEALAQFQPTHIAVEYPHRAQSKLDDIYTRYVNGEYELERNEAEQLGLRLAKMQGHQKVYAIDWNGNPPGDVNADYNWPKYAQEHGQQDQLAVIMNPQRVASFMTELKDQSIGAWLVQLNDPAALKLSHQLYFDIAMIGDAENQIGANWVGSWYARNLKIFNNIVEIKAAPEDRILVIYGQGHAYHLKQMARESERFNVIEPDMLLKDL